MTQYRKFHDTTESKFHDTREKVL